MTHANDIATALSAASLLFLKVAKCVAFAVTGRILAGLRQEYTLSVQLHYLSVQSWAAQGAYRVSLMRGSDLRYGCPSGAGLDHDSLSSAGGHGATTANTSGLRFGERARNHFRVWVACKGARWSIFWDDWVFSTNHRRIAMMYFQFVSVSGFVGLALATTIRAELAYSGHGVLGNDSELYLTLVSMHAVVMVFFVVIPALFGAFGNFLLPTQLGVRDVVFPRLNSFMFWVTPGSFLLFLQLLTFDRPVQPSLELHPTCAQDRLSPPTENSTRPGTSGDVGGPALTESLGFAARVSKVSSWAPTRLLPGWAFITPYSSRPRFTSLGKVDIALVVVFAVSLGSVLSAVNYVVTYRCLGAHVMGSRRELRSFFVDALLVGSRMMIAANPALLIGILLLLSDRHFGTSVFDFSGGGDAVLFQHLFWFFGHPEVYIIIIPCFGFANSLFPHLLRKRLSGRLSLQFSMYTIGFMGFAVWGHHMYMVGLANTTRTLYSTMTVMISVPASTKVLHWCVTLANSAPRPDVSLFFLLAFTYFFVLGGLSGMLVAHIGFDVIFHDTFYVIGHFHVMLSGAAVSCIFAAFYFYFGAITGLRYSRPLAYAHFFCYFWGQVINLAPMFYLGYSGMPRRIMDYPAYFGGWHSISSGGHALSVVGFALFILVLLEAWVMGRPAGRPTGGVSRLNKRFAFFRYQAQQREARKAALGLGA